MALLLITIVALIAISAAEVPVNDLDRVEVRSPIWPFDHQERLANECWYLVLDGTTGWCEAEDCCADQYWLSGKCPDFPGNWRCCFSYNKCKANEVGCSDTCSDSVAKDYACRLLDLYEQGKVSLKADHFNPLGNNPYDGASVLSNIRDTCFGQVVRRSKYSCAEGSSPGGCVCLNGAMVKALWTYANDFYASHSAPLQVSALAGSCHSSNSWHYRGNTMDVACTTPVNHCTALVNFVRQYSLEELCYPGGPCSGHESWVHAAFA